MTFMAKDGNGLNTFKVTDGLKISQSNINFRSE